MCFLEQSQNCTCLNVSFYLQRVQLVILGNVREDRWMKHIHKGNHVEIQQRIRRTMTVTRYETHETCKHRKNGTHDKDHN